MVGRVGVAVEDAGVGVAGVGGMGAVGLRCEADILRVGVAVRGWLFVSRIFASIVLLIRAHSTVKSATLG